MTCMGRKILIRISRPKTQAILTKEFEVRKLPTAPERPCCFNDAAPGLWITSIIKKTSNSPKVTHSICRRASFYNGVENIFQRVAVEVDGKTLKGELWHRQLLENMAQSEKNRPAVVSESLKGKLRAYLEFPRVFRHAYTFELRWEKMAELVLDCEETFGRLETEINNFFEKQLPGA